MTPINFTARYIKPTNIKKLDGDTYKTHTASLVEMEMSDRPVIKRVSYDWMQNISEQLYVHSEEMGTKEGMHIYALTNQMDSFEKLDSNKILGMMMFQEGGAAKSHNTIEFLQVAPNNISPNYCGKVAKWINKHIFRMKDPEHKHIGKALADAVKEMFSEKPIDLYAVDKAVEFYLRNGFIQIPGFKHRLLNHMEWRP